MVESSTFIVGEPNATVRQIYDRMPLLTPQDRQAAWLDPSLTDSAEVLGLLQTAGDEVISFHPVSKLVGKAGNEDPELIVLVSA